jgi:hypothetical protein
MPFALCAHNALAQPVDVDAGYLDTFNLTDGRIIDVGELGGGIQGNPNVHKIFVTPQATTPSPPMPVDGRLTGTVHGKFRVVFLTDRTGDGFINGGDLDHAFDVAWQLVGYDKGPGTAAFIQDSNPGPEGTPRPYGDPASVNFPPTAGGTSSTWNIAACDATGFNPGSGNNFCNDFAIPSNMPFTGFVDYTFPVSIPYSNDFTPGLPVSNLNWILTALVGNTSDAGGGPVTYGRTAAFDPAVAVAESNTDLFQPALLLNYPGETANIPKANLLTTVQISVVPEPATGVLGLVLASLAMRRRRARR